MKRSLGILAAIAAASFAWLWWFGWGGIESAIPDRPMATDIETIRNGAYLARAGNCVACHTARGGVAFAGGRPIETPFGTLYAGNLTPDSQTGLGAWSSADFWRAMHRGKSRDGRLLYPAFPYTHFTQVTRADSDALFAFLRSLPAAHAPNRPDDLRWPFSTQAALAFWRALYFDPGTYVADERRGAEWNRGAYLVRGLGHCSACHTARNVLGGTDDLLDLSGGLVPMQNWYAPSLTAADEAAVIGWPVEEVVKLMRDGTSARATVLGPMAEVVLHSTQHLTEGDLRAMATYLQALKPTPLHPGPREIPQATGTVMARGGKLYAAHCVQCHGERGEGVGGAYPALAGNRAVTLRRTPNLVQVVLFGGYAPATTGNPRPFGMPPYAMLMNDAEVAAVLTYIRASWGNLGHPVSELEVAQQRGSSR